MPTFDQQVAGEGQLRFRCRQQQRAVVASPTTPLQCVYEIVSQRYSLRERRVRKQPGN